MAQTDTTLRHMPCDLSTLSLVLARKGSCTQVTLSFLKIQKEEEKRAKGQAQKEKSPEDKPAFRKEEVNFPEN